MRNIVIVGAGIAGLTAGIYALQSGFDVTIYESHTIPGGASTSWRRKGYIFEGGMHWLTGSSPDIPLNRLWREVGALDDSVAVHYRDVFLTFEYEGQTARLYRDVERLHNHLIELSPEDGREISKLCCDLKRFAKLNMPMTDIKGLKTKKKSFMSLGTILRMLPALPKMPYYARQSAKEYGMRYKSELLQRLFENIIGPDYSATALVFTLATLASGDGGYPEGGSLSMALRMAKKLDILGGKIRYGMRVNTVSVRNGIADGVVVDGELLQSDAVIVTRDTLSAIDDLFDFPIREPWTERMRKVTKPLFNTFICFGIEVDLEGLPERMDFVPMRPLMCGGKEEQVIKICNYAGYEGYAPKGCTAVTSAIIGDT
ncbi:MAG TPA: FAD-dependent oxidoreductase [Mesotoga infera]|uniref:FAD-dependent oxidoreductase n=1 Tax=Mesotoga infera TaxID=1236046 RepID=A0A7C1GT78_9BACT|nr:FAD-dependent oxidoreductase [Mesotoga infera]